MKMIFHIIPNLIVGGAQTFLRTLINGLPDWNHRIFILENRIDPSWIDYDIELINLPQLMRMCKSFQLKGILFHFHWFPPFRFIIPDCKKRETIVTIQDNENCLIINGGIYVASTLSGLQFKSSTSKGVVIPPAVDINKWKNNLKEREKGTLIRHSTIYPQKLSEKIMKDICSYDPIRYKWRIIGVGDQNYISKLQNAYITNSKIRLGKSNNACEELNYSWLYVYHSPYNGEHFGLCFQEALACGIPVITNDQVGAKVQIQNGVTGYICSSMHEMKRRVDELYQNDALYKNLLLNIRAIDFSNKHQKFFQEYERLYVSQF